MEPVAQCLRVRHQREDRVHLDRLSDRHTDLPQTGSEALGHHVCIRGVLTPQVVSEQGHELRGEVPVLAHQLGGRLANPLRLAREIRIAEDDGLRAHQPVLRPSHTDDVGLEHRGNIPEATSQCDGGVGKPCPVDVNEQTEPPGLVNQRCGLLR